MERVVERSNDRERCIYFFNPLNPTTMSKRQSKAGRPAGSRNQLSAEDRELISKALQLIFKTMDKRMDNLSDENMLLFMTKLAPYGWRQSDAADDSDNNNNAVVTHTQNAPGNKKAAAKNNGAKSPSKNLADKDHEIIVKALRVIVNTLCKRADRLSDKHVILFSALLVRYRQVPDMDSGHIEIRPLTVGVAA